MTKAKTDWAAEITAQIIEQMETATDFEMPWHRIARGGVEMPMNATTGAEYRGINTLLLGLAGCAHSTDRWASFKQWKERGRSVAKGSKGVKIVFYKQIEIDADGEAGADENGMKRIPMMRVYTVFNEDQLDDYTAPEVGEHIDSTEALERADRFVAATGAEIREDNKGAYYDRAGDYIGVPARALFRATKNASETENYYSTLFHELTHWTGAKPRLERTKGKIFGDKDYAFEELVAELGAAFLCRKLGVSLEPRADHACYLKSWLKALRDDKRLIFKAAAAAQRAVNYLDELQPAGELPPMQSQQMELLAAE